MAPVEALFVENFRGYEYIVAPSGSCTHHVRHHFDAIPQTEDVRQRLCQRRLAEAGQIFDQQVPAGQQT